MEGHSRGLFYGTIKRTDGGTIENLEIPRDDHPRSQESNPRPSE
jgi:hypothetical protein